MPRVYLLLLCLLAPLAQGNESSHDLAYSLGVKLGERLRDEVPQLQLQALLEGLRQAYQGEPLALTQARMDALLEEHQASLTTLAEDPEQAKIAEQRFLASEKARPGVILLPNGILVKPLRAGNGPKPAADGQVQVRYIGLLADGTQFDETQTPQWFNLQSVIAGWQQALPQMPVGSHWRIVIPSSLAYAAEGAGNIIAPYSPLVFELELLDTRGSDKT